MVFVGPQTGYDCVWQSETFAFGCGGNVVLRVRYDATAGFTYVDLSPEGSPATVYVRYRRSGCPVAGSYEKLSGNDFCTWDTLIQLTE